jgi:hypothetical protein
VSLLDLSLSLTYFASDEIRRDIKEINSLGVSISCREWFGLCRGRDGHIKFAALKRGLCIGTVTPELLRQAAEEWDGLFESYRRKTSNRVTESWPNIHRDEVLVCVVEA